EVSVLTGAAGVDCVALPSLRKDAAGQYHPRHLEVSLPELLALRAKIALATLEAFDPDVLIVDNVPRGALRELDPVLESLRARRRTRLVLGLRDVLATAFADADLPPNTNGVLVTGPCMPADVQGRLALGAAREPRRRVVPLLPEPTRLLRRADHVVAMGGYNTVCEVLSFAKPALIVPR